ncbi:unnamed protein product [Arctia plantaginis]|uniref:Uncharacterized protein n=1 Tax=Arctia plantaginis TaxID=874455 RepID=A0A8S1AH35_ARCPL|nr:unnamed protein product [Arctia plantaginis]
MKWSALTEGWRERGGAAAGASSPRRLWGRPVPCPRLPHRPIAKFNAKVMRARVRLRAAMQERPAAGDRQAVSASPTIALHTASQFPHSTRPNGSPDKIIIVPEKMSRSGSLPTDARPSRWTRFDTNEMPHYLLAFSGEPL